MEDYKSHENIKGLHELMSLASGKEKKKREGYISSVFLPALLLPLVKSHTG